MSEKSLRLAAKSAAILALVALPAFGIAELATHESAPVAAAATTNHEAGPAAAEPTPTPATSKDTTGWD
ncbi:hypothetical protein [Streptomyces sp. PTY087I2]|uniref:hypothetical protein n=1 Tax=Streptomyces sp. PTY087I2 TaxID=1819298 RepID=UPI00080B2211|nr:hypothetical protein [Streptomyces sp. PTY087I2]OCC09068.1 hypothetical protein A3Q37_05089 [Streptomyces sp. PTY087I2]